ncbi:MAG: ATP-dependent DNA helicase RecG, partial [Nocardioides sp.]|nr:ATP-dependent DNA helicase RecG [Nocardioides sp.]
MISPDSPVAAVFGDAKNKRDKIVKNLGIETVGDLLRHFPRRYIKTGELTRVSDLEVGQMLTVIGEIADSKVITYTDRRSGKVAYRLETVLLTGGPRLRMTFFAKSDHISKWQARRLPVGRKGLFIGQAGQFKDQWQLTNPTMVLFGGPGDDEEMIRPDQLRGLYPLYPLTKGVDHWDFQRAIAFARSVVEPPPELLPDDVRDEYAVIDAETALNWIHGPDDFEQVEKARRRYRFEEALVTQLVLGRRRRAVRALGAHERTGGDGALLAAFDARLPFTLTAGQREVGAQIDADLAQPHPMNRLLQGEVGSGKTLVALRA